MLFVASLFGILAILQADALAVPTSFTENFNGGGLPGPYLENSLGASSAPTYSGGAARFSDAEGDRGYLRTIEDDWSSVSFRAEITVTYPGGGSAGAPFFGIGDGTPGGIGDFPATSPAILAWIRFEGGDVMSIYDRGGVNGEQHEGPLGGGVGTHRLRMDWNATTDQLQFFVDNNSTTFVTADFTSSLIDGSNNGFTNANTRIFFGGTQGSPSELVFDDLVVTVESAVPEPSTFVLAALGLAGLGLVAWRRRRRTSDC